MSTQQVRNTLSTQVESVLQKAKGDIKNEGKRKIDEIRKKIPTPEDVMEKLKAEINEETCSPEGKEKFMKIYNRLHDKLTKIKNIIKSIMEKLENIEGKIKPIIEAEGPLGEIKSFTDSIKNSIMPILQVAVTGAPLLLAAFTAMAANAKAADAVQQKRDKAVSKVKEYTALILAVPLMIQHYQNQAKKIFIPLEFIKSKLQTIDDLVTKIQLYMYSMLLQFEEGCSDLENSQNDSVGNSNNPIIPDPNGSTTLDQYMAFLNSQYNDVYNKLQENGSEKAIERIFKIKDNLEEDYNISFKVVNLGGKPN
jgi:DNA repair exonuclease SbcCD ATPase subunit